MKAILKILWAAERLQEVSVDAADVANQNWVIKYMK